LAGVAAAAWLFQQPSTPVVPVEASQRPV
jgi:hypothetical protein